MILFLCFFSFLFFFIGLVRNSLLSILVLVFGFIVSAIVIFFFGAEFLALTYVVVYVGSICMLFLFIIIIVDPKSVVSSVRLLKQSRSIFFIFIYFFIFNFFYFSLESIFYSDLYFNFVYIDWLRIIYSTSNIVSFAELLYNSYCKEIILIAISLFVGMAGPLIIFIKDE